MNIKACCLLLLALALGTARPGAASDHPDDPLLSAAIVLCLRPIRLAEQPGLREAVETVKRLNAFARSQKGTDRKAVDALIFIFKDLYQKEQALAAAEAAFTQAERQALAKEHLADRTETVGSPLSGPDPQLAKIYRKEAKDIRDKATQRRDAALKLMKEKLAGYNQSVSYFQSQGDTEVVIALASSLFAIVDRHLPGFDFKPEVSREWVEKQRGGGA